MQSKIFVLIGMISSGKTTYANNAAKKNQIIINDDAIVNLVHGNNYNLYNKDFKILYKSTENHVLATALALHLSIVVDRGLNVSLEGRRRWLALAASFDVSCEAIEFEQEPPLTHAHRRTYHDCRGLALDYWINVAEHHASVYRSPTKEEGFARIHSLSFKDVQQGVVIQ